MNRATKAGLALLLLSSLGCPRTDPPIDGKRPEDAQTLPDAAPDAGDRPSDAARPDLSRPDLAPTDLGQSDIGDGERPATRALPESCDGSAPTGGTAWTGWGNVQHPRATETLVGVPTEPVYGQVWQEGVTDQRGQAVGFLAELLVGPLGANPLEQPGCFRAVAAEYNVDNGNNDEYWVRVLSHRPGLYGVFYRYRPSGGAWLHGDLDGSTNGVDLANASVLVVESETAASEIRVVTLNLKCRTDQWESRKPLVVEALAAADPHVIGFQEDCADGAGAVQSYELAAILADRLDRGFEVFRIGTHQAEYPEGRFDEGIAMLTAFPIEQHFTIDLPYANFPRKATVMDVRLGGGEQLRLVNTHFDYGAANDDVRAQAADSIVQQKNELPILVTGDFNATPDSPAYGVLSGAFDDVWSVANPNDDGETIPSDSPVRRIDYVFSSGLTVQTAELVDGTDGSLHLSDHLGIAATLGR